MSTRASTVHIGALAAIAGGVLGLYLLIRGPNAYGNYGWDGPLALLAALLLATGFASAYAARLPDIPMMSRIGVVFALGGLVLMGVGYAVDGLWPFIFFGPLVLAPLGFLWLGVSSYHQSALARWWRIMPLVVGAVALLGLGIEVWEELRSRGADDLGLALTQATLSLAGMALGLRSRSG